MSVQSFMAIHPIVVETFHFKKQTHSGARLKGEGLSKSVGLIF